MTISLQRTKLFPPAARAQLVERPRLLERLNAIQSPGCKAVLISAPAGSGKTTLVSQWLAEQIGSSAGWVSLDERDNQPALFFGYLVAALQTVLPGAGGEALPLLHLPGANLEEVVTLLANDLAAAPGPFFLVLDDLHIITNHALHQALDLLLEAQPPQMRVLLISREDPALQLARRRARGQLVELRQDDLRFTLPEAVAFLNHSMDLHLSTEQVEILETRTEGWIAGLQLAALSLQHSLDADRFIREFSGSHRFILDYLMEEVFANQQEDIQHFLLETSILERMCAELCSAVTGQKIGEAQNLLDRLAKANLFVFSLDEERHWYRYHHLFKDLLLARLQREGSERSAPLYRRASDWYEDYGNPSLAVEYALKAQDMSRAADLIELHMIERWQTADLEFMSFINRLPLEIIFERPSLCLQSAWLCVIRGQPRQILPFVQSAEQQLAKADRTPQSDDDANRAFAKILLAYMADLENKPVPLDNSLGEAYASIPKGNTGMRNSVAVVLGTIHYMEGDFVSAMRYYEDALERDKRLNGTNAVPVSVLRMVWVLQKQGHLRQALALITENESYVRQRGSRRFYIVGVLNLLWSEILLEWNQLEEARVQLQEGLRLMEDWPIPPVLSLGYCLLARWQIAQDDLAGAKATLAQAERLQQDNRFHPEIIYALERAQVRLWSAQRNQPALEAFVRERSARAQLESHFRYEAGRIELCRAWLELGHNQEAAALLEDLSASTGERHGSRITILTLLATAHHEDRDRAEAALDEALRLGKPEGYLRTFVDAGGPLRQTLKAWLQHNRKTKDDSLRAYVQRVLLAFDRPAGMSTKAGVVQDVPEPLSRREQEVLQLMAEGLTNQQIADRLVISIRTVKKHVENIHGKLGVENRTRAIARGRALGLLNP
ncbi:MAG TPA: LuxR C-terminal-related transcriptional regulator [Anaerolineales bacterium]|nr:LuxR C-terminal-related transcriptional regulator [Anaerolineales bacterium]